MTYKDGKFEILMKWSPKMNGVERRRFWGAETVFRVAISEEMKIEDSFSKTILSHDSGI
jgi:hypothetical protein